jgi:hypothetical protein
MSNYKKGLFVIISFFIAFPFLNAQQVSIEKARDQFFNFDKTEDGPFVLYKSLEHTDLTNEPVLLAYRGAASAAAASTVNGVRKKLEYFNRGKAELEQAVSMKPLDAEIRFLRLATQTGAPGFLGYSGDKKNDKAIIITTLMSVPANHSNAYLYQRICTFMLSYAALDANEKVSVNQLLTKFNKKM